MTMRVVMRMTVWLCTVHNSTLHPLGTRANSATSHVRQ